jgi:hypothetical protein
MYTQMIYVPQVTVPYLMPLHFHLQEAWDIIGEGTEAKSLCSEIVK